jgi:hypothetical protein
MTDSFWRAIEKRKAEASCLREIMYPSIFDTWKSTPSVLDGMKDWYKFISPPDSFRLGPTHSDEWLEIFIAFYKTKYPGLTSLDDVPSNDRFNENPEGFRKNPKAVMEDLRGELCDHDGIDTTLTVRHVSEWRFWRAS